MKAQTQPKRGENFPRVSSSSWKTENFSRSRRSRTQRYSGEGKKLNEFSLLYAYCWCGNVDSRCDEASSGGVRWGEHVLERIPEQKKNTCKGEKKRNAPIIHKKRQQHTHKTIKAHKREKRWKSRDEYFLFSS